MLQSTAMSPQQSILFAGTAKFSRKSDPVLNNKHPCYSLTLSSKPAHLPSEYS